MKPYSTPPITVILYALGALSVGLGAFILFAHMAGERVVEPVLAFSGILGGIFITGMGSALDYLARSAYWAEYSARVNTPQSAYRGM